MAREPLDDFLDRFLKAEEDKQLDDRKRRAVEVQRVVDRQLGEGLLTALRSHKLEQAWSPDSTLNKWSRRFSYRGAYFVMVLDLEPEANSGVPTFTLMVPGVSPRPQDRGTLLTGLSTLWFAEAMRAFEDESRTL